MVCLSSNDVYFTQWMVNRAVHIVLSFLGTNPVDQVHCNLKENERKVAVDCSTVVCQYNKFMGGVEMMDE